MFTRTGRRAMPLCAAELSYFLDILLLPMQETARARRIEKDATFSAQ